MSIYDLTKTPVFNQIVCIKTLLFLTVNVHDINWVSLEFAQNSFKNKQCFKRKSFMLAPMEFSPAAAKKKYFQIWESGDGSKNNEEDSHILSTCKSRLLLKLGKSSDCS